MKTPTEALNAAFELLPERITLLAIQLQEAPNQEQRQVGG